MYGLSAKKSGCCSEVAVSEGLSVLRTAQVKTSLMGALFDKRSSNKIKYLFQVEMIYPRKLLGALHVPVMTRFSQVHVLKIATPEFEISYGNLTTLLITLFFSYSFYYYSVH